ncbi:DUF2634 domain-containing protein [Clostridium saccharoperbutylacetonicum]|uniref:DUF2634 domain-containing protein n=1 Tax=Clostridium saccharoperbutylacetonicum TaxID=36745 RepID=UPI0009838D1F|nr:DUF2634 domain-containing protein [Clostridium saccharoperbutylacetonicum]AQR98107.1 hypothetical protein CLSAP_54580 [Clostridium saccharoperbutylacetonicum]NSB34001.1 hypothetical protein [Clostridium saccharoperbutylacetonicum]
MFFPLNQDQNENINIAATQKTKFGKSFLFDFDKGDFILIDGKTHIVEGEKALKIWIKKALKTEKYKYKIYEIIDDTYGIELNEFIHSDYPTGVIYAGIQSSITEMLTNHLDITAVTSFEFTRSKQNLSVSFIVLSTYGAITEGVSI